MAERRSCRLLLVRRPLGRERGAGGGERRLFRAVCRRGGAQLWTRTAPVVGLVEAAADDSGWEPVARPLLLVCTHGRKDWCCAVRGRPVAAALAAAAPQATWECSHLGGDRFAATVLELPSGCTYGRVQPEDAGELAAAAADRRVVGRLLRGRSTDSPVAQAADALARTALDHAALDHSALDDLRPLRARRGAQDGTWVVDLAHGPGSDSTASVGTGVVRVHLQAAHVASPQRLSCGNAQEQHARTWRLLDLQVLPAPAPAGRGSTHDEQRS